MWFWTSTDGMAAEDRADRCRTAAARTAVPYDLRIGASADFEAGAGLLELGGIEVSRLHYSRLTASARRPARLIRESDPERYVLVMVAKGAVRISVPGTDTLVEAGGAVLLDTSHPHRADTAAPDGTLRLLGIPRPLLALPADRLDATLGQGLPARDGIGAVLGQFLRSLEAHADGCAPDDPPRLARTVLDLATGLLAHRIDAGDTLTAETHEEILRRRIDTFIDRNLGDPALTPGTIAAHHHIALRSLHLLFRSGDETVAATIRRRRLERCRRDLTRPELRHRSIAAIAGSWGFASGDVFGRSFRTAYGVTPREFRHTHSSEPLCAHRRTGVRATSNSAVRARVASITERREPRNSVVGRRNSTNGHSSGHSTVQCSGTKKEET